VIVKDKAGYKAEARRNVVIASQIIPPEAAGGVISTNGNYLLTVKPDFFISHLGRSNQSRAVIEFPAIPLESGRRYLLLSFPELQGAFAVRAVIFDADGQISAQDYDRAAVVVGEFEPIPSTSGVKWLDITEALKTNTFRRIGVRVEITSSVGYALDRKEGGLVDATLVDLPAANLFNIPPVVRVEPFPTNFTATAGTIIEVPVLATDSDDEIESLAFLADAARFSATGTPTGPGSYVLRWEATVGTMNLCVSAVDQCGAETVAPLGSVKVVSPEVNRFYLPTSLGNGTVRVRTTGPLSGTTVEESRDLVNWTPLTTRYGIDLSTQTVETSSRTKARFYRTVCR
jgi:hypothetical protein